MADYSALIEQLEAWADELEKVQGAPGAVRRVIAGMREVAVDLGYPVPDGLQRRAGVEFGCSAPTCTDCYEPKGGAR